MISAFYRNLLNNNCEEGVTLKWKITAKGFKGAVAGNFNFLYHFAMFIWRVYYVDKNSPAMHTHVWENQDL